MRALPFPSTVLAGLGVAFLSATLVLVAAPGARAQDLADMAGQMILSGFQGSSVGAAGVEAARADIAAGRLGGVMYLATNIADLDEVRAMNERFRAARPDLPPFIALDQEGGSVERLTGEVGFVEIPQAAAVARDNTPAGAREIYGTMARRVAALGFNLNFGPVVDLNTNPDNPVIARFGRSFGADPARVTDYASAFIEGHRQAGLLTALKHFPGHGSSTADSHEGFTDISESWQEAELEPYRDLVGQGLVDMVMMGHLFHSGFEDRSGPGLPASLSPVWTTQILRRGMDYDGVVISDDLEMGAIRDHYDLRETVVRAVMAGTDILLFSNTANARDTLADEVHAILVETAAQDPAFRERIEQSYRRIIAAKQGLMR